MWLEKQATTTSCGSDAPLAVRVAGFLGVGRIAQQQVHASTRLLRERVQVGGATVEGRLIDLEVAGVQDRAVGRVDHDRYPVRDRVRHAEESHREQPCGRGLAGHHLTELGAVSDLVLLELALQERERERRPVDGQWWSLVVAEQVRERTDVVLMPVGQHDALDVVEPLPDVLEVREDEIDAGHLGVREGQPDVDDQDAVVELHARHVPPDLTDASEEDDARGSAGFR
jgi:hypothetical protein